MVNEEFQAIAPYAVIGAPAAALWTWTAAQRRCSQVDAWLAHARGSRPQPQRLARRTSELVAPRHRRMVGASLRRLADEPNQPRGLSARVPVDTAALRTCAGLLTRAAHDLEDVSQPVSARAVALAEELITDPGSPVYLHTTPSAAALEQRLRQTLFELERSM